MERWLVMHRKPVDWRKLFRESLELMNLTVQDKVEGLRFQDDAGEISWRRHVCGSKILLRIDHYSSKKQTLVATALWKAARYH